ncbi:glycosyltransferase family 2 protein [Candidatus Borrarchaeum sp.]|uniref:glycosyltransferase n=1 Tax=Candidatus Borrarchaeum sp. TaxID=2846742 RepID=UPI00257A10DB|nr:glycosyltransferase family 2 protein [Candidatus Borrarchaeum sp.]
MCPSLDSTSQKFDVSIVVTAYNEERLIERSILSSLRLKEYNNARCKIIYVCDIGSDTTHEIAKYYREQLDVLLIRKERGGKASALRDAMKHIEGDYILFLDADCLPPIDFVDRMLAELDDDLIGVQAIPVPTSSNRFVESFSSIDESWGCFLRYLWSHLEGADFIGRSALFKADIILDFGWKDYLSEDLELSTRLILGDNKIKYTNIFVPEDKPKSLKAFIKQRIRWATGAIQVAKTHFKTLFSQVGISRTRKLAYATYMLFPIIFYPAFILVILLLTFEKLFSWPGLGLWVYPLNYFIWCVLLAVPLCCSWLYVYGLDKWKTAFVGLAFPFMVPVYTIITIGTIISLIQGKQEWYKTER